jgi:nucleoside-diphosphate-sugar epimerase
MGSELVLVSGGSGFIGVHCILQLLRAGYRVRTTVRSLEREQDVRAMLRVGGVEAGDALTFAAANLTSDAGWPQAVAGSDYVLHVASPFPLKVPKDENELIVPAREGALRVLRAARDAGVRRVVLTSSFAAVGYGTDPGTEPYTEENWTNTAGPGVTPYVKSKTLAERAAWDFIAREGGSLELSVVNPVAVFGPVFSGDLSTSIVIVQRLLDGGVPACPRLKFGVVDVRDVASLHLSAMTHPAAAGERFLAVTGSFISILEIAQILRERLGTAAARVPTREMPDWILRIVGLFDSTVRQIVPELGNHKDATSAKAQQMLGWKPLTAEESILATAESLIELGLVKG